MEHLVVYGPAEKRKNSQPVNDLSPEESETVLQEILDYACEAGLGESELCKAVSDAGFAGDAMDVDDLGEAGYKVRVWGPNNSIIDL